MGRAAGEDLNPSGVVEVAKTLDDIAVERIEIIQRGSEEAAPEARRLGQVDIAGLDEESLVLARGCDLSAQVPGELGDKGRVRQLLQQDRGEANVEVGGNAVALQAAEHAQQRQVSLCGGLVQPLHAVRPGAVIHHVR